LGELVAFAELVAFPARRKCARLPFATLLAALHGTACASTEEA
jgi:nitrogen fixation NifU-like protein